ncbi:Two-component sensor PilS [hydrothermal vent metagenome]|uniref:Two-component sensor PilS n=1 Tax=hydrothermal vent metagenome TaxID=652676 RepID=A0A3B1B5A0_9ZZZZ
MANPLNQLKPSVGKGSLEYTWRPLEFLNKYRLLIATFFTLTLIFGLQFHPLASHDPQLFFVTSLAYLFFSGIFILLLRWQWPGFYTQIYLHISIDIFATVILMHASGGVSSGLGTLLIIVIAGGSILVGGRRQALFLASIASLLILFEVAYGRVVEGMQNNSYTQAGILGLTLFTTAIVAHVFARRIRESEALATRRSVDLANMAELTEHVIQRMQTGIVVIDYSEQVRLMNESAWHMFGMPSVARDPALDTISSSLAEVFHKWLAHPEIKIEGFSPSTEYHHIVPRFARIGQDKNSGVLIFLEDASSVAQRAQQLQLASLGRLTASIAHEIRNPLGAISHAGQLLDESPNLDKHDLRLTRIISDQSQRMNTIIESIMQLGRRDNSHPEVFKLRDFLQRFLQDFMIVHADEKEQVKIEVHPADIEIRFDTTHLQQILTNLCENGLRHSQGYRGSPRVELRGGMVHDRQRSFLDVIDHGTGIPADILEHIFEPFYTTSNIGSGLGLYISRELAECNQANVKYIPMATGGSCFRISFQDPRRHMS